MSRQAQLVGEHLHRRGEIERGIARIGRNRRQQLALFHLRAGQAEGLVAEHERRLLGARHATTRAAASRADTIGAAISRTRAEQATRNRSVERFFEARADPRVPSTSDALDRPPHRLRVGKALRRTSTRCVSPIVFIARAAAPMLPGWRSRTGRCGRCQADRRRRSPYAHPRFIPCTLTTPSSGADMCSSPMNHHAVSSQMPMIIGDEILKYASVSIRRSPSTAPPNCIRCSTPR